IFAAFIGLYPVAMPAGQSGEEVAARLHRGASTLPNVRAFDLIAHSACAPEETACLAGAARRAGLDAVISTEVRQTPDGYRWTLRDVSSAGKVLAERTGDVRGGVSELAAALEATIGDTLSAAHSTGWLRAHVGEQRSLVSSA